MSESQSPIDELRELRGQAQDALMRGEPALAAELLERATPLDPTDDETPTQAAMIRFEAADHARAAAMAVVAARRRPFHPAALNLIGVCCLDSGHADMARKVLTRVTRMAPRFRGAKMNLRAAKRSPGQPSTSSRGGRTDSGIPLEQIRGLLASTPRSLTVCLPVRRDDEAVVGIRALDGIANEIVVIDMTPHGRLGEKLGQPGKVEVVRWTDGLDAAGPRNAALRVASSDWILMLEAGERLPAETVARLRRVLVERSALYALLEIRHRDGHGYRDFRLFRNAPGIRYVGRVEPRIHPALLALASKWGLGATRTCLHLETSHVPCYTAPRDAEPALLAHAAREELEANPADVSSGLQCARMSLETGDAVGALGILSALPIEVARIPEIEAEEYVLLKGRALMRLERFEELAELIRSDRERQAVSGNTWFMRGVAARNLGDPRSAVAAFRHIAAAPLSFLPPMPEILRSGSSNLLGAALLDTGQLDEAATAFEDALAHDAGNLEARLGLLGVELAAGRVRELLEQLDRLVEDRGDDARAWTLGATVLSHVPRLAEVNEHWMEEACRRFPDDPELRQRLGEARLSCGRGEAALEVWVERAEPTAESCAARFAARLCCGGELPDVDAAARQDVEERVLGWLQRWAERAAFTALDRALLELPRAEDRLPGLPSRAADWLDRIDQPEAAARIRDRCAN